MKIRKFFVSNSSSSSFIIHKSELSDSIFKEICKIFGNDEVDCFSGSYFIGITWDEDELEKKLLNVGLNKSQYVII